ncbi:MAG TPA: tRNA (adenosine(37)-N6)-threonylcarbamoyltransferase complex dimerization subunit type 1 TsaB [Flavisolibacter sp.]
MSYILHIDTAVTSASVCLSDDQVLLEELVNPEMKDHAAWLHPAIRQLLADNHIRMEQLSAIAVGAGPGSYTGLRVGMAAVKGLCFALGIPMITIPTLKMMAAAAIDEKTGGLLCPMIDARRQEVFTAVFDQNLLEIRKTGNMILDPDSFSETLEKDCITFFGNGSRKFQQLTRHTNASFAQINATARHMIQLSFSDFTSNNFADTAYAEPQYGKEFYTPSVKASL